MSTNSDNWQQFKDYWDNKSPRNGAIAGAIGGAIGGVLASIIIAFFIFCCLKKGKKQKPNHDYLSQPDSQRKF